MFQSDVVVMLSDLCNERKIIKKRRKIKKMFTTTTYYLLYVTMKLHIYISTVEKPCQEHCIVNVRHNKLFSTHIFRHIMKCI